MAFLPMSVLVAAQSTRAPHASIKPCSQGIRGAASCGAWDSQDGKVEKEAKVELKIREQGME